MAAHWPVSRTVYQGVYRVVYRDVYWAVYPVVYRAVDAGFSRCPRIVRLGRRLRRPSRDDIYSRNGVVVDVVAARGNPSRASGSPFARACWSPPRRPMVDAVKRRLCPARGHKPRSATAVDCLVDRPANAGWQSWIAWTIVGPWLSRLLHLRSVAGAMRRPGSGRAPGRQPRSSSQSNATAR